jgi:hypothetical protein
MESTEAEELKKRDVFFSKENNVIREELLILLIELRKANTFVFFEEIDTWLFGSKHPYADERRQMPKAPDDRYTEHFNYLQDMGYCRVSGGVKARPLEKAHKWNINRGPL